MILIYDSLTRRKRALIQPGHKVNLYVCGITASGYAHLGHAFAAMVFEVLHRYLNFRGYFVKRVQNFTDVDDKIITKANQEGLSTIEVAEKYIQAYFEDMDALNILRADLYPRATNEIPQMITLIHDLVDRNFAYEASGSVYFRVNRAADYGKLSGRSRDEMLAGTRVDLDEMKEDPADFALWKASKPTESSWPSPWGDGRPGWHIECSAMAIHHLGESIDIHGGGIDLIFPHHENEIAQSEAHTGFVPFASIWMHNGHIRLAGEKMSKSLGNLIRVRDALQRHSSDAIRLWMLGSHYRAPLLYEEHSIDSQERALRRLRSAATLDSPSGPRNVNPEPYRDAFISAMDDDLNTSAALASIFGLAHEINRGRDNHLSVTAAQAVLWEHASVLGFTLEAPRTSDSSLTDDSIQQLVKRRSELRNEGSYQEADLIRNKLADEGILLSDSAEGTSWSRT